MTDSLLHNFLSSRGGTYVIWNTESTYCTNHELHLNNNGLCEYPVYTPPKPKPIDVNHPHVCFLCKRPLFFSELLDSNLPFLDKRYYSKYKHLKKLWKCTYVQFYCCSCYQLYRFKSTFENY